MMRLLLSTILLMFGPITGFSQSDTISKVRDYRSANERTILQDYIQFLEIPNVATDIPNMRRNADWIVSEFEKRGAKMELLELPDRPGIPPVVYGEITVPDADRTLVLYVHYDGQPADPSNWTHHPWKPTLYSGSMERSGKPITMPDPGQPIDPDWRIYGRSASDDKAPVAAILAALDALRHHEIPLTSNLKFFFDGEEEIGSPNVRQILQLHKEKLDGDIWLFFDGPMHQSGRPQVVFGVRGFTGMEITIYGPNRPLHSGHYGGWAPVPGQMLAQLLSSMKRENGEILIEGFHESTAPITSADRDAFATLPDMDSDIRRDMGLTWTENEGRSLIESYMHPSLTIRGLSSGNTGELARNVIPTQAVASLGIRLAKGNDPVKMLEKVEAHIRKEGFHIVRQDPDPETRLAYRKIAKVTRGTGYPAMRTSVDNPMTREVVDAIRAAASDDLILYPTMGGTLPLFHFEEIMQKPIVIVPIANHDNNQHAPDENIRLGNLWYGIDIYSAIFTME